MGIDPFGPETDMPHFTKKHYEKIALVLKNSSANISRMSDDPITMMMGATVVVSQLADMFAEDNHRFNKRAFLDSMSKEK